LNYLSQPRVKCAKENDRKWRVATIPGLKLT